MIRWYVVVLWSMFAATVQAQQAPPLVEFSIYAQRSLSMEANATLATIRADPLASELRIGHSAPAAVLEAQALSISLPGVASDPIAFAVNVERHAHGLSSLHASDDSSVSLVVDGLDVLGDIRIGDALYKLTPLGGGMIAVYRYDTSQLRQHPENWDELMRQVPDPPPRDDIKPEPQRGAAADTGDVIDIMVVYTSAARVEAGNIGAFIQFAIDNTHRAYRNTSIRPRLRLVHKYETSYAQHSDIKVDLDRLSYTANTVFNNGERPDPEGYMDEVHALRDRHGADLVVLIVGRHTDGCGWAWIPYYKDYPNSNFSGSGFSVIVQSCETSTHYVLAHEIGHNHGARHDPDNNNLPKGFPYGHGFCNTVHNWNTVMAYSSNNQGNCWPEIPYFSSPFVRYQGVATGDREVRDNRRVLNETALRVANFRQKQLYSHTLPFIPPANMTQQGFMRIINYSKHAGEIEIHAIDDTGQRFGPVTLEIGDQQVRHFNSNDLERGNASKGLLGGVGSGTGMWRLELKTLLDITPLAYIRTADGFVTSMHQVAEAYPDNDLKYRLRFFNPGSNTNIRSLLRVVNLNAARVSVTVKGWDDDGNEGAQLVRFSLAADSAIQLSSQELESGDAAFTGRLGDGNGKWELMVTGTLPLHAMSLLSTQSGHLTNLSR